MPGSICRDFERKILKKQPRSVKNSPKDTLNTKYRLFSAACSGPLVAEYGVKNIFESKPVNHSCVGPFPAGLEEEHQKTAEIGRK